MKNIKQTFDNVGDYIKCNKYYIIAQILMVLSLFSLDFSLRYFVSAYVPYLNITDISPNLFTLGWIIFYLGLIYILPKKVSIGFASLLTVFFNILFIINIIMFKIKDTFVTFNDIFIASEGFAFINMVAPAINFKVIAVMLFSIISAIIAIIIFIKTPKKKNSLKKNLITFFILIIVLISTNRIAYYSLFLDKDTNTWGYNELTMPRNNYDTFVDPIRNMQLAGMYEYTNREIYFFAKKYISRNKKEIEDIENYFNKSNIIFERNEYTDIFKDKNLILIMAESLDKWPISENVTPTLTKMIDNGLYFSNFYGQGIGAGSTLAAEFSANTGLYFDSAGRTMSEYSKLLFSQSLANKFKNAGYYANSIHANDGSYYNRTGIHKSLGFENHFDLKRIKGTNKYMYDLNLVADEAVYNMIVPKQSDKFFSFITTYTGHGPYGTSNYYCRQETKSKGSDIQECFEHLTNVLDQFLGQLIEKLEASGLLEDTVIAVFSDHYAYSYPESEELYQHYENIDGEYKVRNIPFIIYNENLKKADISAPLAAPDIAPTILNLFGLEFEPKYYIGQDVFSEYNDNILFFNNNNWYDGETYYSINNYLDDEQLKTLKMIQEKLSINNKIINNDYFRTLN